MARRDCTGLAMELGTGYEAPYDHTEVIVFDSQTSFSSVPTVQQIESIPVPANLLIPVDPHQVGPSDDTGTDEQRSAPCRPPHRCPVSPCANRSLPRVGA